MASLLDAEFVDAAEVICFDTRGRFDAAASDEQLRTSLMSGDRAVVPGFYGSRADGIVADILAGRFRYHRRGGGARRRGFGV